MVQQMWVVVNASEALAAFAAGGLSFAGRQALDVGLRAVCR
ncbi:hypothetical protein [Catenulispora rubra]|nr:hypothetical protein [Catenulispora rubra]